MRYYITQLGQKIPLPTPLSSLLLILKRTIHLGITVDLLQIQEKSPKELGREPERAPKGFRASFNRVGSISAVFSSPVISRTAAGYRAYQSGIFRDLEIIPSLRSVEREHPTWHLRDEISESLWNLDAKLSAWVKTTG